MNTLTTDHDGIFNIFRREMEKGDVKLEVGQTYLSKHTGFLMEITGIDSTTNKAFVLYQVKRGLKITNLHTCTLKLDILLQKIKENRYTLQN